MQQHIDGIGDEAIYLRINQLQKGLLQLTDYYISSHGRLRV
jgi:hypothetical protein